MGAALGAAAGEVTASRAVGEQAVAGGAAAVRAAGEAPGLGGHLNGPARECTRGASPSELLGSGGAGSGTGTATAGGSGEAVDADPDELLGVGCAGGGGGTTGAGGCGGGVDTAPIARGVGSGGASGGGGMTGAGGASDEAGAVALAATDDDNAPSELLEPLLEEWPDLLGLVLAWLDPTDCALLAQAGNPWLAAVVSRGLPRAGKRGAVLLKLKDFVGRVETLAWAKDNACPWEEETCALATTGGHLEVLQWARKHGCPWAGAYTRPLLSST